MTQTTQHSARLRADVAVYASRDGYVLRVGETHHHVRLAPADADALLDALVVGGSPDPDHARAALDSLIEAGLVDPLPPHHSVTGDGALAGALRAALLRMGVCVGPGGSPVVALDDDDDLPPRGDACWISGDLVLLAPPGVPARDVAARRCAATAHRDTDPLTRPLSTGRTVTSAVSVPPAGLELAAVTIAAELLRRDRPAHEAVTVDLHGLAVFRRPVLPVPPAPR
jgi:hypothetical protein